MQVTNTVLEAGDEVTYLGKKWEVMEIEDTDAGDAVVRLAREVEPGYWDRVWFDVARIVRHDKLGWVVKNRIFE